MNGVIETATGDLLRAGYADFLNDGAFNPAVESYRVDVPEPAFARSRRRNTQIHRWGGVQWTLIPYVAANKLQFLASSKMVENEVTVTEVATWQVLGGVVTTPGFFAPVAQLVGRIVGQALVSGAGAELRVVEKSNGFPDAVVLGPAAIADSAGAWKVVNVNSNATPRSRTNLYELQGRLNGAVSMKVRYMSLTLLRVAPPA